MMTRKRRNKILKLAKGYWGAKSKHFKMANEQVMKSLQYAYTGRRLKKRDQSERSDCTLINYVKEKTVMPKVKTHSGAKKRFNLTKNGKVKRAHATKSHLLNGHGKPRKLKRNLRKGGYADVTNAATIKRMVHYK